MNRTLVDAGPLVALLDRDDKSHQICLNAFKSFREPLVTTWAVITEAMYLLADLPNSPDALLEMLERGVIHTEPLTRQDLSEIRRLMLKYGDLPMDFADASLVRVADREKITSIFTIDRRDFSVYRLADGKPFTIVP